MATQPAAGGQPTPIESIGAIFGPTSVVANELSQIAHTVIKEKASAAPRSVNIFQHDTAEQLTTWAAGSLWRYQNDVLVATVAKNVVVPSPAGGAEVAFSLMPGSGAQAHIVLERPAASQQVVGVMANVLLDDQPLTIQGGAAASIRLEINAQSFVDRIMLSVPGVLPEHAVTPSELAAWLGKPWEVPTRRVVEVDDAKLGALLRACSAQTMQLRQGGGLDRTLSALAPFATLVTPAGVVTLPDLAGFASGVIAFTGNDDKLIVAQGTALQEPGRADLRPQCGTLFSDAIETAFDMLVSLLGTAWPAAVLEALQTAVRMPAVSRGAGVSRGRIIGNALRRAVLAALERV